MIGTRKMLERSICRCNDRPVDRAICGQVSTCRSDPLQANQACATRSATPSLRASAQRSSQSFCAGRHRAQALGALRQLGLVVADANGYDLVIAPARSAQARRPGDRFDNKLYRLEVQAAVLVAAERYAAFFSSLSARRRILPTLVLGSSARNSTYFGRL